MLRIFYFVLVLIFNNTLSGLAQPQIVSFSSYFDNETTTNSFNKKYKILTFSEAPDHILSQKIQNFQVAMVRELNSIAFEKNINFDKFEAQGLLNFDLAINEKNELDFIIYSVLKRAAERRLEKTILTASDSLKIVELLNTLAPTKVPDEIKTNSAFRLNFYVPIGSESIKLDSLQQLHLAETKTSRPDTIVDLNLSRQRLTEFPAYIFKFKNLETLDLSGNKISKIPSKLWKMKKLKKVYLIGNPIDYQSFRFKKNKNLQVLNLQNTDLTKIPKTIRRNKQLDTLLIGNNRVALTNKDMQRLQKLKVLNLYNASLNQLPDKIDRLKNLQEIDLYHNNIRFLPMSIVNIKSLKVLALSYNDLWNLPPNLNALTNLEFLFLHHNKLNQLPQLPDLKLLDLGYNDFSTIPEQIFSLKNIEEISVEKNRILLFSKQLLTLQSLQKISLSNNPKSEEKRDLLLNQEIIDALKTKSVKVF